MIDPITVLNDSRALWPPNIYAYIEPIDDGYVVSLSWEWVTSVIHYALQPVLLILLVLLVLELVHICLMVVAGR